MSNDLQVDGVRNCMSCPDPSRAERASQLCTHCNRNVCRTCFQRHCHQHQTEPTGATNGPIRSMHFPACPDHPDRKGDFFCKIHNVIICGGCSLKKHDGCSTNFLPDLLDKIKAESQQSLHTLKTRLDIRNASFQNTVEEIRQLYTDIVSYVQQKQSELIFVAEKLFREDEKTIKQAISHCEAIQGDIGQLLGIDNGPGSNIPNGGVISPKQIETRISGLQDRIEACATQCKKYNYNPTPYTFIPSNSWRSLMTSRTDLGVIESDRVRFYDTKFTKLKDFNVKTLHDESMCWISGITRLENNMLLMADSVNKVIKQIHTTSYNVNNALKLIARPWDIAAVEEDSAAVTLPDFGEVQTIVCNEKEFEVVRKFRVEGKCYGICSIKDRLVVSFSDPPKVELFNRAGLLLRKFEIDPKGKFMFRMPEYVQASQTEGMTVIYVSDWRNNTITKMVEDGTVLYKFKEKGLVPGGIVVSSYGELLVCNREKNRLHLIDKDGKQGWKRLRKNEGLNMPYALCYCQSDNRLFVASCMQDKVSVYQLVLPTEPSCHSSLTSSML